MVGRLKKRYNNLYRDIFIEIGLQQRFLFATIMIMCPICQSTLIGTYGTKMRKYDRVEIFQCKNSCCPFRKNHQYGKQFSVTKSYRFKQEIWLSLTDLYIDLVADGAKNKTIAKKYHISDASISLLRKELEDAIQTHHGLDRLVKIPHPDRVIAIDETFLKIEGKSIYIIIATGYTTHKTLGIKVSKTRKAKDIREVFNEAERNTKEPIIAASIDAWGASQKMAKNLNREFTLIIHKHKKPYDKAVIRHFTYTDTERKITDIGVKVDVFKRRGVRVYYYQVRKETLLQKPPNPVGRPKGVKKRKRKKKSKIKKKKGRKGLFQVFAKGKKNYMKIDPYRKTLKFSKGCLGTVAAALNIVIDVFARITIQNNLAENINSVLQSIIRLKGPKSIETVENRLRATLIARNDSSILQNLRIRRNMHGKFVLNNVNVSNFARMAENGWNILGLKKKEVLIN